MSMMKFTREGVCSVPHSSKSVPGYFGNASNIRVDGDPYFYADITLNDVVVGSRYWLVDNDDNSTILATGIITSNPQIIADVPALAKPQVLMLRLRNASNTIKYKQYQSINVHQKTGTYFYCAQQID